MKPGVLFLAGQFVIQLFLAGRSKYTQFDYP